MVYAMFLMPVVRQQSRVTTQVAASPADLGHARQIAEAKLETKLLRTLVTSCAD